MSILRTLFYITNGIMLFLTLDLLLTIVIFIFLGVLINPLRIAPFGFALLSISVNSIALFIKMFRFKERVMRAVEKRIEAYKAKVIRIVPGLLLDVMLKKNIRVAFQAQGITYPKIIITVLAYASGLVVVYSFLFVGFAAFTDPSNVIAAIINSCVVIVVGFVAQQAFAKEGEEVDIREKVDASQDRVVASLRLVFDMVTRQVLMARQLFIQMER